MKALIIIPTFNEIENIEIIIREVFSLVPQIHILIVDDNSPDGTATKVKELQKEFSNLFLLERESKKGLGTAYIKGFSYALDRDYEFIFEMDADRSHDPHEIIKFLEAIKDQDLVIGSRYIQGGKILNWPWFRLFLSWTANKYAKGITGMPLIDSTGGFKCFRRRVLEKINFETVKSEGYAFQIEINHRVWKNHFKIKEIPIVFSDRTRGKSKMSRRIIWEALWLVWRLRFM